MHRLGEILEKSQKQVVYVRVEGVNPPASTTIDGRTYRQFKMTSDRVYFIHDEPV